MDNMDKSEKRAEYRNSRQSSQGKGDADNRTSRKEYSQGYEGIDWGKKGGDKTGKVHIVNGKITRVEYE